MDKVFESWKIDIGEEHGTIQGLTVHGEDFVFGVRNGHVRTMDWNGDRYSHEDMKCTKISNIISWLITCRDMREVYKVIITFVLK